MDLQFIPVAQAQGIDGTAQPTFGPISVTGGGSTTENVQIQLKTDATTVSLSDTFKVTIALKSGSDISLSEYQIVIKYDPLALTVVDQDATTTGTQVKLLDSLFEVPTPLVDNNNVNTNSGLIFLRATSQFPQTVNRDVIEIEFQGQKLGTTEIQLDTTPISGTRTKRGSTDIPYTTSSLTLQIDQTGTPQSCTNDTDCATGQICLSSNICGLPQTTSCTTSDDCSEGQLCVNNLCTIVANSCTSSADCDPGFECNNSQCIQIVSEPTTPPLPRTALSDDLSVAITVGLGMLLIGFGLFLSKSKNAQG